MLHIPLIKPRYKNLRDAEFICADIKQKQLVDLGIVEKSTSPWRTQIFIDRDGKTRRVISYSETTCLLRLVPIW